jgi:hypothetical protein
VLEDRRGKKLLKAFIKIDKEFLRKYPDPENKSISIWKGMLKALSDEKLTENSSNPTQIVVSCTQKGE